jgi:hypothetical protein
MAMRRKGKRREKRKEDASSATKGNAIFKPLVQCKFKNPIENHTYKFPKNLKRCTSFFKIMKTMHIIVDLYVPFIKLRCKINLKKSYDNHKFYVRMH